MRWENIPAGTLDKLLDDTFLEVKVLKEKNKHNPHS